MLIPAESHKLFPVIRGRNAELFIEDAEKLIRVFEAAVLHNLVDIQLRVSQKLNCVVQPLFLNEVLETSSCALFQMAVKLCRGLSEMIRNLLKACVQAVFLHIADHLVGLTVNAIEAEFLRGHQIGEEQKEKCFQGEGLMEPIVCVLLDYGGE